jgi:hypothetical protein
MSTNTITAITYQRINEAFALYNEAEATHSAIRNHPARRTERSARIDQLVDRSNRRCWRRLAAWSAAVAEMTEPA